MPRELLLSCRALLEGDGAESGGGVEHASCPARMSFFGVLEQGKTVSTDMWLANRFAPLFLGRTCR